MGRLVFYRVGDFGGSQVDSDKVVAVPVHFGGVVGRDFDVENADRFIFEDEVMVRLGGDFDFGSGLGGEEYQEEKRGFHATDCSTGAEAAVLDSMSARTEK